MVVCKFHTVSFSTHGRVVFPVHLELGVAGHSSATESESSTGQCLLHHIRFSCCLKIHNIWDGSLSAPGTPEGLSKAESCFQPAVEIEHEQEISKMCALSHWDFGVCHCVTTYLPVTIPHTKVYKDHIIKSEIQTGCQPQFCFVLSKEPLAVARRKLSQIVSIIWKL